MGTILVTPQNIGTHTVIPIYGRKTETNKIMSANRACGYIKFAHCQSEWNGHFCATSRPKQLCLKRHFSWENVQILDRSCLAFTMYYIERLLYRFKSGSFLPYMCCTCTKKLQYYTWSRCSRPQHIRFHYTYYIFVVFVWPTKTKPLFH